MNTKVMWAGVAVVIIAGVAFFMLAGKSAMPGTIQQEPVTTGTPAPGTPYLNDNEGASAGKLNIDVVCEGALAYMTFPDSDAAAKFVAECKAGEHPEVIEKYRADMNLGDGTTI